MAEGGEKESFNKHNSGSKILNSLNASNSDHCLENVSSHQIVVNEESNASSNYDSFWDDNDLNGQQKANRNLTIQLDDQGNIIKAPSMPLGQI